MKIHIGRKYTQIETGMKLKVSKGLRHLNLSIEDFLNIPVVQEREEIPLIGEIGRASLSQYGKQDRFIVGYTGYPDYTDEDDGPIWSDDKLVRYLIEKD
jgi:hypothetical protein